MMLERTVERQIEEAMQAGKFDKLAGKGRPLDLTTYFETPPELRLTYSALRSAGFVPREVELLNRIEDLKAPVSRRDDPTPTEGRLRELRRLELELGLLMERGHRHRATR